MSLHPYVRAALDDIKAQPDDDTPRLMLADWLEENGATESERDRGSFLRLQVQRAKRPLWDPRRRIEETDAERLFERHREAWSGGITPDIGEAEFLQNRGLLRLRFRPQDRQQLERFLADETLWAWTEAVSLAGPLSAREASPPLSQVDLREVFERVQQVLIGAAALVAPWQETLAATEPHRLTTLRLMVPAEDRPAVDWLLRQPLFPVLRELWADVGSDSPLAEKGFFPELRRLHMQRDGVGRVLGSGWFPHVHLLRAFHAFSPSLGEARGFPSLRELILCDPLPGCRLGRLVVSPILPKLTRLTLARVRLDTDAILDLFEGAGPLASLRIEIGQADQQEVGEVLGHARTRPDLRELALHPEKATPEVGELLASSPLLESLDMLDLASCQVGPRATAILGRSAGMIRWRHLDLSRNPLGADGLQALFAAGQPLALESLDLACCKLEPGALCQLEPLARLAPNLIALELAGNQLDDDDFTWLASWDGLGRIEVLTLDDNRADRAGVAALLRSPRLARCRYLRLPKGKVPSGMLDATRARFGSACC